MKRAIIWIGLLSIFAPLGWAVQADANALEVRAEETWHNYTYSNQVNAAALEGNFVWAATTGGVVAWDLADDSYEVYTTLDGLRSTNVRQVFVDDLGHKWFGYFGWDGKALTEYDGIQWTHYTTEDGLAGSEVFDMALDAQGELWFATQGGVSRFDRTSWTTYTTADGLAHDIVLSIALDQAGHKWFGTRGGVSEFDGTSWTTYTTADGLVSDVVHDVAVDPAGNLWVAYDVDGNGVTRFDGATWTTFTAADGLVYDEVRAIAADPAGNVWFGTYLGMSRFDSGAWTTYTMEDGLAHYRINDVDVDDAGNVWASSDGGINQFDGIAWETYATEGLHNNAIFSAAADEQGDMWFASGNVGYNHGVSKFDGNSWTRYTVSDGLVGDYVWTIAIDGNDHKWFGTMWDGVSEFDGTYWTSYTTAHGLVNDAVYAIAEDRTGHMWFGTGNGVSEFDGATWTSYTTSDGLVDNAVRAIAIDNENHKWFGTWSSGVSEFDGTDWKTFTTADGLADDQIQDIAVDEDGDIWFATESGVSRFDGTTWTKYTTADGLAYSTVSAVAIDQDGNKWFGYNVTPGRVSRFDGVGWTTYTTADGLVSGGVVDIAIDPLGHIWFGTGGGVSELAMEGEPPAGAYIEINQVLGNQLDGDSNFVAGKDTAVRVFVPSGAVVDRDSQHLVVKRDSAIVTTLYPAEQPGQTVDVLTFLCPSLAACGHWQAGTYDFEAMIDGKIIAAAAEFQPRTGLRILAVKVKVTDRGEVKHLPDDQWETAGQFLAKVYPLAFDGLDWWMYSELDATAYDLTSSSGKSDLWEDLNALQPPKCGPDGPMPCFDEIIGFIPPMAISAENWCVGQGSYRGWTYPGGAPSTIVMANGTYIDGEGETVSVASMQQATAHEVGHTAPFLLGDEYDQRNGAFQCSINPPPNTYVGRPYDSLWPFHCNDTSCATGPEDLWPGLGTGSMVVAAVDHPFDVNGRGELGNMMSFMGSATPPLSQVWVTPAIYSRLFDGLGSDVAATRMLEEVEVVRASGWIGSGDSLIVDPWYHMTALAPDVVTGTYTIEALDGLDQPLASQGFEVSFLALSNPPDLVDPAPFQVTVACPAASASLRIRRGDVVLGTVPITVHPPTVAVTAPSPGQVVSGPFTIEWQSDDLDGDVLYHTVEYSPNGQSWLVLTGGTTETQFTADFDLLGGSDTAQLRVTVSDGVNTAESSVVTFVVTGKPPRVYISNPVSGSVFAPGATVTLHGSAFDPQDGWMHSESSLVWASDRDGSLGNGELLNMTDLSQGRHTITLTATNSAGLTGSTEVSVFISYSTYLPLVVRSY